MKTKVVVLLSGGIDSSACLHYYRQQRIPIKALFIDYGQPSKNAEIKSAKMIALFHRVSLDFLKTDLKNCKSGELKGRNAFLLFLTLIRYPKHKGMIAIGIHKGSHYYDTSQNFIHQIQSVFDGYTNGNIKIEAPFISINKQAILNYSKIHKLPINLTYSCETGNKPCGRCLSCKDRKSL